MTALNAADRVYLGSQQVLKVYLGSTLVYEAEDAEPIDISSSIVPGTTIYTYGELEIPAWDQSYIVNAFDTYMGGSAPSGLGIKFLYPATRSVPHSVNVTYTMDPSRPNRRVFHFVESLIAGNDHAPFRLDDGLLIEADSTAGSTTTLTYTWNPATQSVSVTSYVGSPLIRDYGPDNADDLGFPLYFSPEVRAMTTYGGGAAWVAAITNAVSLIPENLREMLGAIHATAEITQGGDLTQAVSWRSIFDPTQDSGLAGLATGKDAVAMWNGSLDPNENVAGQSLLHEIGHIISNYYLPSIGYPAGINPYNPLPPDSHEYVYYPTGEVEWDTFTNYEGDTVFYTVYHYDIEGNLLEDPIEYQFPSGYNPVGRIEDEVEVRALYNAAYSTSSYYTSEPDEFVAQNMMIYFASLVPISSSAKNLLMSGVGGSTRHNAFVAYMQGIGAFPT